MKVIIAGTRWITDFRLVDLAVKESGFDISQVVTGDAVGPDWNGAYWGYLNGKSVKHFPARWDILGKSAGFARNKVMGEYAGALIAVWDRKSRGTAHMITIAKKLDLLIYIKYVLPQKILV